MLFMKQILNQLREKRDQREDTKADALVFVFKAVDPAVKGLDLMNLEWFVFENRKE